MLPGCSGLTKMQLPLPHKNIILQYKNKSRYAYTTTHNAYTTWHQIYSYHYLTKNYLSKQRKKSHKAYTTTHNAYTTWHQIYSSYSIAMDSNKSVVVDFHSHLSTGRPRISRRSWWISSSMWHWAGKGWLQCPQLIGNLSWHLLRVSYNWSPCFSFCSFDIQNKIVQSWNKGAIWLNSPFLISWQFGIFTVSFRVLTVINDDARAFSCFGPFNIQHQSSDWIAFGANVNTTVPGIVQEPQLTIHTSFLLRANTYSWSLLVSIGLKNHSVHSALDVVVERFWSYVELRMMPAARTTSHSWTNWYAWYGEDVGGLRRKCKEVDLVGTWLSRAMSTFVSTHLCIYFRRSPPDQSSPY